MLTQSSATLRHLGWALGLYVLLRLLLAPVAATIATPAQQPNMQPAASAAQRTLVSPWDRWDVEYYRSIAADGYGANPKTTNFHPLYAWAGRVFGWLTGGNWLLGLLLASGVATIALYRLIERLAQLEGSPQTARWTAAVLTLLPGGFILYAPYSESLFLACAVACFICLRQRRWWWAGLAGLLASLTRQQGIVLVLPMVWEMAAAAGGWRAGLRRWRWWLAATLPLVGFGLVVLYRAAVLGGLPAAWWLPQNWIYSLLISPAAQNVVPGQRFVAPWTAIWLAFQQLGTPPTLPRWVDLITGAIYLGLLAAFWRSLRPAARVYCVAVFLLAFAYHTGDLFAYMGLSRHLLLAFPLALPLARWSTIRPRRLLVGLLGGGMLLLQTVLYVAHAWVP
jgi:hypothetical protein